MKTNKPNKPNKIVEVVIIHILYVRVYLPLRYPALSNIIFSGFKSRNTIPLL